MQSCETPIFIVGAQRSGTTLLRLILNAHSQIAIPEEARFLVPLLTREHVDRPIRGTRLRNVLSYIAHNPQFARWNYDPAPFFERFAAVDAVRLATLVDALYGSFCASEGKHIWGDKSLFFEQIDVLHALFPGARFIHVVRDGRDVFNSWRRIEPGRDRAAVVALDWRHKLQRIERSFTALPEASRRVIRYEDLLEQPEATTRALCAFCGVPHEEGMLEFYRTSRTYIGEHHSELIFQPIDRRNVGKWQRRLTGREARIFTTLARRRLERHGYPTGGLGLEAGDLGRLVVDLAVGLPRRAWQVVATRVGMRRALRRGAAVEVSSYARMPSGARGDGPRGEPGGGA
ncbi:MAG: sulfotransferase [Candidatus Eiseniibacteriota bacterium]